MQAIQARSSLLAADAVIAQFGPEIKALDQIGHLSKTRIWPFPKDTKGNLLRVDQELLTEPENKYRKHDRVLLWLSRVNYINHPNGTRSKGADHFLYAFAKLVKNDNANVHAVIGDHGSDTESFRRLADELNLTRKIDYVPHLPFWKLLTYLSVKNSILIDGITPERNTVSGIVREGLCMGAPIVTNVDQSLMNLCSGADLPIDMACESESCLQGLRRLVAQPPDEFRANRDRIQYWSMKHLDFGVVVPRLFTLLEEIAYVYKFRNESCQHQ